MVDSERSKLNGAWVRIGGMILIVSDFQFLKDHDMAILVACGKLTFGSTKLVLGKHGKATFLDATGVIVSIKRILQNCSCLLEATFAILDVSGFCSVD